nr:RNA-directed DNA polymerase, eukaryota, reverse transcriptase zinc-binding domain protein [Tanacetum cinerariifolium]
MGDTKRNVEESKEFKFHECYKEMKLNHLSFADDLLVLCHVDKNSIKVKKDSLLEFSNVFGLIPNMEKSVIFFGSVKTSSRGFWRFCHLRLESF